MRQDSDRHNNWVLSFYDLEDKAACRIGPEPKDEAEHLRWRLVSDRRQLHTVVGCNDPVTTTFSCLLLAAVFYSSTNKITKQGGDMYSVPRLVLASFAALAASACTTSLTHDELKPGVAQTTPGFPYYLPKQRFQISVTYELTGCPNPVSANATEKNEQIQIVQSATITETPIADESEYHVLTYPELNSFFKTSTFSATTYENKTIHTVGATIEDRSAAIIKSTVGSVIAIAKIAIGIPTTRPQAVCQPFVYDALKKIRDSKAKLYDPAVDEKGRAVAVAVIAAGRAALQIQKQIMLVPEWTKLSESTSLSTAELDRWFLRGYEAYLGAAATAERQKFSNSILTEVIVSSSTRSAPPKPIISDSREGIIFRDPAPASLKVCVPSCSSTNREILASLDTQVAQFGRYMVISLKNSWFDKNNVTLSFAANGRLESMTFGSESSLEKAAGALQDATGQFAGLVDKVRAADKAKSEAAASAELNAIKAQTELLNAKADQIEAQNRLTQLGGP